MFFLQLGHEVLQAIEEGTLGLILIRHQTMEQILIMQILAFIKFVLIDHPIALNFCL